MAESQGPWLSSATSDYKSGTGDTRAARVSAARATYLLSPNVIYVSTEREKARASSVVSALGKAQQV